MSQLPAAALRYETVVAEYFLGLRGSGLMLSPLDLELVRAWECRGLPVAVVCRGLRAGHEAALRARGPDAPPPRALRAYRLAVEDEWRAYRAARVGDAPGPGADEVARAEDRLDAARAAVADALAAAAGACRAGYEAAAETLARLGPASSLALAEDAVACAEDALLRGWLAALPRAERAALGPRCRLRAGARPPWTRPRAYRAALRAHLEDASREAGLLPLRAWV